MSDAPPTLMIAMPCRAEIRAVVFPQLLQCILQAAAYWHRRFGEALVSTQILPRTHVVTARNTIAAEARAIGAEWVLWIDDDMAPGPNLLEQLHSTGEPFAKGP